MRKTLSIAVAILALFVAAVAYAAPAERRDLSSTVEIAIPAQSLASALLEFSAQTGMQVVTAGADVRRLNTAGFSGKTTVRAVLEKLLAGSGLSFKQMGENTVGLVKTEAPAATESLSLNRVAQAEGGSTAERDERGETDPAADAKGVPEMMVKGKRSANAGIERTRDDVQPYVVFGGEDIRRAAVSSLEEFLRTRLPMNAASASNGQSVGITQGNQSAVDLRGLGADQTLILVDGRRMPGVFNGVDFGQPDINGIALSSVERIEILPSTAGGIYGGGATGGVINIVLKRDYQGIEAAGGFDNTFDSDAARRRIDINSGFSLEGGRTRGTVTASYSDAAVLSVGDRDFARRGRALQFQNNRAAFFTPGFAPFGYTTNIRSSDGTNLRLKTGQVLTSPFTYVPVGYAGPQSDNGLALIANAGQYNLELPDDLTSADQSLVSNPTMRSASLNLRRDFTDWLELFVDGSFLDNNGRSMAGFGYPSTSVTLPRALTLNPFDQNITVRVPLPGLTHGSGITAESETVRAGGGAIVRLPGEWSVQAEYGWNRSTSANYSSKSLTSAAAAALTNGTLNVLRDVNAMPLDFSSYYFQPVPNLTVGPREVVLRTSALRFAGPLMNLAGGPIAVAAVLERRDEESLGSVSETYVTPTLLSYTYYPPRGHKTDSLYAEVTAPLVGAANARRGLQSLDLQASLRHDKARTRSVDTFFEVALPVPSRDGPFPTPDYVTNRTEADQVTLGFRYKPVESLAFRASFGSGVLPPSVGQLPPLTIANFPVASTDPKRGNTFIGAVGEYRLGLGGNPDLDPEQSDSWSAGAVFTTQSGLRLSLDYTRIEKTDEIVALDTQVILDLEDEAFSSRIVRAALTAQDIALGYTGGRIQILDGSPTNIARSTMEAWDVQIDWDWSTRMGDFNAYTLFTRQEHLQQQIISTLPEVEIVGFSGGPLRWRGNGGLNWTRGAWNAGWNMQYYDSYLIYTATASAASRTAAQLNQGSAEVPHQLYHDVFVEYRFGRATGLASILSETQLSLSIANVLDRSPPILATTNATGGYSFYGDPRLRRYSLLLRKRFH